MSPKSKNVTRVVIPSTVKISGITYRITSVSAKTFKDNKKIKMVSLGDNVNKIGTQAFCNCKNLKTIEIGKKVKNIGSKAFYNSCNLKNISIKSKYFTEKSVSAKAFSKINKKAIVNVPKSKLSSYKKLLKKKGITGKSQKFKVLRTI